MGLLSSFLGKDQRRDIQNANAQATKALETGYNQGYGDYSTAASGYDPYVESGTESQAQWKALMGLDGTAARDAAYGELATNPLFTGQLATNSNALVRQMNAYGRGTGQGQLALAGARVLNETGGQWVDRYGQGGQMGLSATGAKSNALMGRGDLSMGYGATKAGNAINYGNALASSRNVGINNILNLAGTAAGAVAAFSDIRLKRDIVRIGATPAGLPVYRFKYITGDDEHIGVMAQEAREIFPDAVFAAPNGFLMVDYARIG